MSIGAVISKLKDVFQGAIDALQGNLTRQYELRRKPKVPVGYNEMSSEDEEISFVDKGKQDNAQKRYSTRRNSFNSNENNSNKYEVDDDEEDFESNRSNSITKSSSSRSKLHRGGRTNLEFGNSSESLELNKRNLRSTRSSRNIRDREVEISSEFDHNNDIDCENEISGNASVSSDIIIKRGNNSKNNSSEAQDDPDPDDDDNNNNEDDDDGHIGRKYNLRKTRIPVETLNIKNLGGDGGGLSKSRLTLQADYIKEGYSKRDSTSTSYREPKMYLVGKIPNRSKHHHRHHRHSSSRRHYDSSTNSSSDSSDGSTRSRRMYSSDESDHFNRHERRRISRELDSVRPINALNGNGFISGMGGSVLDKASKRDVSRADATPLAVDPKIGFQSIGGLHSHVRALKEMVVLPLLYPEVFSRFDTQPPRGVLFVGPPGTGIVY